MKGTKIIYICSECEYETPKWLGKCPHCGAWNSFVEDVVSKEPMQSASNTAKRVSMLNDSESEASPFSELDMPDI